MTTNRDWLFSLPLEEQYAWMNAEHQDGTLDGDTAAQDADSRELILTDLEKKTREWHDYDGNFMRIYSGVAYAQMKELLDRQAAITEREYGERMASEAMCSNVCAVVCEQRGHIAELQVKVDELTAERERYREKFGKCLDYADAIHALMDDEGMA